MITAIVNDGPAAWAFEEFALRLADVLWTDVSREPADYNYVLGWPADGLPPGISFIPWAGIQIAADKRKQAEVFARHKVPTPRTVLLENTYELRRFLKRESWQSWALKYPISCGGSGHELMTADTPVPEDWPLPFVLQEFIRMERPEVYRLYGVRGKLFGWNARRFPENVTPSPWVAHARGARYVPLGDAPTAAKEAATAALTAAGLNGSFGIVDLIPERDRWVVLEVGTDGVFNHVDRDFDNPQLDFELNRQLAEAFWSRLGRKPWGENGWRLRSQATTAG